MDARELDRLLGQRGADLSRWPERERARARRLLRCSPRARARYLAALAADTALVDAARLVDPGRCARMRAEVMRRLTADAETAWPAPAFGWGALAAAALLGLWIGWTDRPEPAPTLLAALQLTPFSEQAP